MALCTFIFTHYLGLKYHGVKYIKHFLGPVPALAPLFLPIELIGHSARVMSLTLRLFGNIMGEDLVLAILLMLAGAFLAPLPMMFLAVFTSIVQAFIFSLLSMMYFAVFHGRSSLNFGRRPLHYILNSLRRFFNEKTDDCRNDHVVHLGARFLSYGC